MGNTQLCDCIEKLKAKNQYLVKELAKYVELNSNLESKLASIQNTKINEKDLDMCSRNYTKKYDFQEQII